MTEKRKQEIISRLKEVAVNFEPSEFEPELSMFSLVSGYNNSYDNPELIGGKWVRENIPEFAELP